MEVEHDPLEAYFSLYGQGFFELPCLLDRGVCAFLFADRILALAVSRAMKRPCGSPWHGDRDTAVGGGAFR